MLLPLTACGGGGGVGGQKVEESDFANEASTRANAQDAPNFKTAKMSVNHYQKVQGQARSESGGATYTNSGGQWSVQSKSGIAESMSNYIGIINVTMPYYQQFTNQFSYYGEFKNEYYLGSDTATVHMTGSGTLNGSTADVDLTIVWNKWGMLTSYVEINNYKNYSGYGAVYIKETFKISYSA